MNSFLTRKPREITLHWNGDEVDPGTLFRYMYEDLGTAIRQNRISISAVLREGGILGACASDLARMKHEWETDISSRNLRANVAFNDGSRSEYRLVPRTNFDIADLVKIPNVVFLQGEGGDNAVLREARVYSWDKMVEPLYIPRIGDTFDREASRQFYDSPNGEPVEPEAYGNIMLLPEPQVIGALKEMYDTGVISRVTPHMRVIGSDATSLWYVRDHLQLCRDVRAEPHDLARYFATLHALGLMEFLDRSMEHCAIVEGISVGNYDLDFVTHTQNSCIISSRDMENLNQKLDQEGKEVASAGHLATCPYKREIAGQIRSQVDRLQERGINELSIFSYMTRGIEPNKFRTLDAA
ncbi:MAG: hypothetical protein OXR66_00905 [Candidatus Woesearchaeota archaeon]|nr:hypothetical protein [Candidatus Woesearchaeota archaeon]